MTWLTDHLAINTETRLLNQGESPALDLRLAIKVEIVPSVSTVGHSIDVSDLPDRPITPLMSGNDFTHKERLNLDLTTINSALDVCKKAMFPPMIAIDIVANYRLETDPPDTPDRLTSLRYMLGPKLNPTASNRLLGWNWLSYQGAGRGLAFTKGNDDSVRNHLT